MRSQHTPVTLLSEHSRYSTASVAAALYNAVPTDGASEANGQPAVHTIAVEQVHTGQSSTITEQTSCYNIYINSKQVQNHIIHT